MHAPPQNTVPDGSSVPSTILPLQKDIKQQERHPPPPRGSVTTEDEIDAEHEGAPANTPTPSTVAAGAMGDDDPMEPVTAPTERTRSEGTSSQISGAEEEQPQVGNADVRTGAPADGGTGGAPVMFEDLIDDAILNEILQIALDAVHVSLTIGLNERNKDNRREDGSS